MRGAPLLAQPAPHGPTLADSLEHAGRQQAVLCVAREHNGDAAAASGEVSQRRDVLRLPPLRARHACRSMAPACGELAPPACGYTLLPRVCMRLRLTTAQEPEVTAQRPVRETPSGREQAS